MELSANYDNGILTLQRKKYIEDGWYIEYFNDWGLFEIPQYGGQPQFVGNYPSLRAAMEKAMKLT